MKKIGTILIYIMVIIIMVTVIGLSITLLWNWLMPYLFSLPPINFIQALGVYLLCELFFKQTLFNFKEDD